MNEYELYIKRMKKEFLNNLLENKKRQKNVFGVWNSNHKYSKIKQ